MSHLLNKSYGIQSEEACDQICFRDLFLDKMIHKAQHSLLSLQFEYEEKTSFLPPHLAEITVLLTT